MSSVHVLVVEDEADVRELLSLHLKREGYTVAGFEDAEEALTEFSKTKFDLIVLDWMLPKMSGLDFCKRVRTQFASQVPVMLLTARADTMDKVLGLEIGADDYLTKPFEVREFVARVRALLRRAGPGTTSVNAGTDSQELNGGPFRVNLAAKQVFLENNEINLTPNEYKLFVTLMQKAGTTFERGDLIKLIQGPGVAVVDRTIDTTVLGLRKKLGNHTDWVETVRGFGYRFKNG
jgi:DNA-binding response OmpR family regulator